MNAILQFFPTINSFYVLIGSISLGASAGLLGTFTVLRRQGLLADTLSHAALPGIAIAFIIMQEKFLPGLLLGALIAGLLGNLCITLIIRHTKIKPDTAMATVLSVFFGAGILLLTYLQKFPTAAKSGLDEFLFGRAAALLKLDVIFISANFLIGALIIILLWKEFKIFIFDPQYASIIGFKSRIFETIFTTLFVLSILMSLQAVGVVLTAALFITPASAALLISKRLALTTFFSTIFGMIAGGTGAMISSTYAKMPTGPLIVISAFTIFALTFLFAPSQGVISRIIKFYRSSREIQMENALGKLYRAYEKGVKKWTEAELSALIEKKSLFLKLKRKKLLKEQRDYVNFTAEGLKKAQSVIKKHRLWESYLAQKMHLPEDHVHRDAEEMEHIITEETLKELEKDLQHPKKDPHDQPIPK